MVRGQRLPHHRAGRPALRSATPAFYGVGAYTAASWRPSTSADAPGARRRRGPRRVSSRWSSGRPVLASLLLTGAGDDRSRHHLQRHHHRGARRHRRQPRAWRRAAAQPLRGSRWTPTAPVLRRVDRRAAHLLFRSAPWACGWVGALRAVATSESPPRPRRPHRGLEARAFVHRDLLRYRGRAVRPFTLARSRRRRCLQRRHHSHHHDAHRRRRVHLGAA